MFLYDDEGDSANAVPTTTTMKTTTMKTTTEPSYNVTKNALALKVTPSVPQWLLRVRFSWLDGALSVSSDYEWTSEDRDDEDNNNNDDNNNNSGEVRSEEAREKALEFLRRKLKVEEVLVLGIRSGEGEEGESSFSFSLEKGERNDNNDEEEGKQWEEREDEEQREEEDEEEGKKESKKDEKRGRKGKSLNWEKYGENGILIKTGGSLDLTTKFLLFTH